MMLCGVWCSKDKPSMNFFLKPSIEAANKLFYSGTYNTALKHKVPILPILGVEVCTPTGKVIVKACIITFSCDLPARAVVLNMRQFNGQHGCHLCEDKGSTAENNKLFRWWPYESASILRTKETLTENSIHATVNDEIVS